jgi:hypothetical protein
MGYPEMVIVSVVLNLCWGGWGRGDGRQHGGGGRQHGGGGSNFNLHLIL